MSLHNVMNCRFNKQDANQYYIADNVYNRQCDQFDNYSDRILSYIV